MNAGLLAQLRSGHHKQLGYYQHYVDAAVSDICERCDLGETDDTPHWLLRCASTSAGRQRIFGRTVISMVERGLPQPRL